MAPPNPPDLSKIARDAFYVTVGLGVMTVQKAQVRRKELERRVESRVKTLEERWQALVSDGAA